MSLVSSPSVKGFILLANRTYTTKGKGLKSRESVIQRANVLDGDRIEVGWSYPVTGKSSGVKAIDKNGTSWPAIEAHDVSGNPVIIYTFTGAVFASGDEVGIAYDAGLGDLVNTKSGNVVSTQPARLIRNDL